MKPDLTPLLGPRELANILGVKPGTIFSWISRGIPLPPCVQISGTRRWRPEVIAKWIEAKEKEKRKRNFQDRKESDQTNE